MIERPLVDDEHAEQPPDRGMEGFKLVGWGLLCTLVWLVVIVITGAVVAMIDEADEAASETGLLVFVIGQGTAGILGSFILPNQSTLPHRTQRHPLWRRQPSLDRIHHPRKPHLPHPTPHTPTPAHHPPHTPPSLLATDALVTT